MSVQHTPGPWSVVGREPTPDNVRFGHWNVEGKSNVANECTFADARLIAGAPELLEALDWLMGALRSGTVRTTPGLYEKADAAIAKAKGDT